MENLKERIKHKIKSVDSRIYDLGYPIQEFSGPNSRLHAKDQREISKEKM